MSCIILLNCSTSGKLLYAPTLVFREEEFSLSSSRYIGLNLLFKESKCWYQYPFGTSLVIWPYSLSKGIPSTPSIAQQRRQLQLEEYNCTLRELTRGSAGIMSWKWTHSKRTCEYIDSECLYNSNILRQRKQRSEISCSVQRGPKSSAISAAIRIFSSLFLERSIWYKTLRRLTTGFAQGGFWEISQCEYSSNSYRRIYRPRLIIAWAEKIWHSPSTFNTPCDKYSPK